MISMKQKDTHFRLREPEINGPEFIEVRGYYAKRNGEEHRRVSIRFNVDETSAMVKRASVITSGLTSTIHVVYGLAEYREWQDRISLTAVGNGERPTEQAMIVRLVHTASGLSVLHEAEER
jgi:hypothetical protein